METLENGNGEIWKWGKLKWEKISLGQMEMVESGNGGLWEWGEMGREEDAMSCHAMTAMTAFKY